MGISTHILDTTRGRPAAGVLVTLDVWEGGAWREIARGVTNEDGRVKPLLELIPTTGAFRIGFEVSRYFEKLAMQSFYPRVHIEFLVASTSEHYHVPLLLNPYGFSTYRGS